MGNSVKFTYGDQFQPEKIDLVEIIKMAEEHEPNRDGLQNKIKEKYWEEEERSENNANTLAMNTLLSINAYGLIDLDESRSSYQVTGLAKDLKRITNDEERYEAFAAEILANRHGMPLLKSIRDMKKRGDNINLENLAYELQEKGYEISPSCTYHSTMKAWLAKAGVFPQRRSYEINWNAVQEILGLSESRIEKLYNLTSEEKYFLMSMLDLDAEELISSSNVAEHTRSVYRVRLTTKQLVKEVIKPLEEKGLIESQKTTAGRGAKPHEVKLSDESYQEFLRPVLEEIAEKSDMPIANLDKPFDEAVEELESDDKHIKGKALEIVSIWLVRLLGLEFTGWRKRSEETGGGEVDVMAANKRIIYNRWQIQCKNQEATIGVDVIAKEVGLTYLTEADIVAIVTTSQFSDAAKEYAERVMRQSRYYVIMLNGDDIDEIVEDRTKIVEILNRKAERVFLFKEFGFDDDEDKQMADPLPPPVPEDD